METMTITRGLSELKLLAERIESATGQVFITVNKKSSGKVSGIMSEKKFIDIAKSNYQKVTDLINRRNSIKQAIVTSNSKVIVEIGGKKTTVAAAIERKNSIGFEQTLLLQFKSQYNKSVALYNTENTKVEQKADELLTTMLGADGKQKATKDDMDNILKPYIAQNEYQIIDPLKISELIVKMEDDITTFVSNVDFILSESNAINKIEI